VESGEACAQSCTVVGLGVRTLVPLVQSLILLSSSSNTLKRRSWMLQRNLIMFQGVGTYQES
jgi:hypothetical protein